MLTEIYKSNMVTCPIFKGYLENNIQHLLYSKNSEYTDIPIDCILNSSSYMNLSPNYKRQNFRPSSNKQQIAGIYAIRYQVSNFKNKYMYVGSATNISTRFYNHYHRVKKNDTSLLYSTITGKGGFEHFQYSIIKSTCNYAYDFIIKHKDEKVITPTEFKILLAFTQYEVRSIEQAILRYIKPGLNSNNTISITRNWYTNKDRKNNRGDKPILAISKTTNEIYSFPSIRNAATALNIEKRRIQTFLNTRYYQYSSTYGDMLKFMDPNSTLIKEHPYSKRHKELYPGINYRRIPANEI